MLLPDVQIRQNNREWKQVEKHHEVNQYERSTPVMVRSYHTPNKWTPGHVDQALGHMHYDVNVDGRTQRRHVDPLRPCSLNAEQTKSILPSTSQSNIDTDNNMSLSSDTDVSVEGTPKERVKLLPRSTRGIPPTRLDL